MGQELFIPQGFGAIDPRFQNVPVDNELGEGIVGGFAVLAYPGKVWTVKHKGTATQLKVNPDDPTSDMVQSVEIVIIKSSKNLSKLYYINGYVEGSTERPDCFSSNGMVPDPGVPTPQANTCTLCPHNAFGSAPGTGKGKACSDDKRLAIVPLADMENEFYGGPMLLRIPADSLQPLEEYSALLKKHGAPYYAIATKVRFDPNKMHQRLLMNPLRALTRAEVDIVMALREDSRTSRVINSVQEVTTITQESNSPQQPFYEQSEVQAPAPNQAPRRPAPPPGATPPPPRQAASQSSPPQATQNPSRAATQNSPAQTRPAPAATTPPAPPPRPIQQASKPAQTPPIPASAQAPKPTGGFVAKAPVPGGFARPANPPAAPTATPQVAQAPRPAPTTIAGAMAQPAQRPVTQRVVQTPPLVQTPPAIAEPAPVEELDEYGNPAGTVYAEYAEEADQLEGQLPDALDAQLDALLNV